MSRARAGRRRSIRGGRPRTPATGRWPSGYGGLAVFAVLCGVLLLSFANKDATTQSDVPAERIRDARRAALEIERALREGNYGLAQTEATRLRDELDEVARALEP